MGGRRVGVNGREGESEEKVGKGKGEREDKRGDGN